MVSKKISRIFCNRIFALKTIKTWQPTRVASLSSVENILKLVSWARDLSQSSPHVNTVNTLRYLMITTIPA